LRNTLFEVAVVVAVGVVLGTIGNAISSDGLQFTHDYFPGSKQRQATKPVTQPVGPAETQGVSTNTTKVEDVYEQVGKHLRNLGLQTIDFEEVRSLFEDPAYEVMFIDARTEKSFAEGHLPGAFLFDRFHEDKHIGAIQEAAPFAMKIIVYCGGGECEDSEEATFRLQQLGFDPILLYVFVGGMEQWESEQMPVERGERDSGDFIGGGQ
jgi:rhodanese-related sulfurtransferase